MKTNMRKFTKELTDRFIDGIEWDIEIHCWIDRDFHDAVSWEKTPNILTFYIDYGGKHPHPVALQDIKPGEDIYISDKVYEILDTAIDYFNGFEEEIKAEIAEEKSKYSEVAHIDKEEYEEFPEWFPEVVQYFHKELVKEISMEVSYSYSDKYYDKINSLVYDNIPTLCIYIAALDNTVYVALGKDGKEGKALKTKVLKPFAKSLAQFYIDYLTMTVSPDEEE